MAYSLWSTYINIMIQHQFKYLVLCLMARDYLAILATTCITKHSFSLSGRTDDPRWRQMNHVKFSGLQKICAGYMDGQLNTEDKVIKKYIGDFTFDDDEYLD